VPFTVKQVIRQLVPPILISAGRVVFPFQADPPPVESEDRRLLRLAHERLNQNASDDEICMRPGLTVKIHPDSRMAFDAFCYLFPEAVAEMDNFLKHTAHKRRLLDVGALHGVFSVAFSALDPAKTSVAVDASPIAFARLLYNVHKNALSNVLPVECAMSDAPGAIRMHYEWEHAVAAGTAESSAGVRVVKRTGDELCTSLQFSPDVIKIDVEGHEVKVLRGLRAIIARERPLIFLEIHPPRVREEGDSLGEVETMFTELGYRLESVAGEALPLSIIPATTSPERRLVLHPT
jgi:FkbM family methyltransferase